MGRTAESTQLAIEPLLDPSRLADAIAQVVELGPTNFTPANDLDAVNPWGMQQEDSLNPDSLKHPSDRNGFVNATIALGNHGPFVGLGSLFVAFLNDNADSDGVTDANLREAVFELFRFDGADNFLGVHGFLQTAAS
jgi:hypothetical protein